MNFLNRIATSLKYRFTQTSFNRMEKMIRRKSLVGDRTFFDQSQFSWVQHLESRWIDIRKELDEVMQTDVPSFHVLSPSMLNLTRDDRWKTFFLFFFGKKAPENCKRCPVTTEIVKQIPGMKTAFFSILAPNKHIPPHRGPYNGVLRCHLALIVPKDNQKCRIRVGSDIGYWKEGKALLFDDSYEHEVWNDTEEIRVVLFIDFLRPLPTIPNFLNRLYIKYVAASAFVKDTMGNVNAPRRKKEDKLQPA